MSFAADWLNLLVRWAHIVVGIGWIGTSFYFIALDLGLRKRAGMNPGVSGTAWEVHGGGFYHVEKYTVAPASLPGDLIWFRWEAYLTWVTGFGLLALQYYWNAGLYLINPEVLALAPWQAIAISIASLAAGWFAYDAICRSPVGRNPVWLGLAVFALIVVAAAAFGLMFSGRGALIHVGAFIGTIMAVNVFGLIVPNQRRIVAALLRGEAPDPALGALGKQRSVHNNYLTLPVLVLMVSNHYPMLTGHPHVWLLVALILVMGASARHFLNRHDAGDPLAKIGWTLPVFGLALIGAVVATAPRPAPAFAGPAVADAEALAIVTLHCSGCHARQPTHAGFDAAPKDVRLESLADLRAHAAGVLAQAVNGDAMPLGNETNMTADERAQLGAWLAAQP